MNDGSKNIFGLPGRTAARAPGSLAQIAKVIVFRPIVE